MFKNLTFYATFVDMAVSRSIPSATELPLRERSKRARRARILAAARAVFSEHGYETATTREIAERADVGRGTVFLYAHDKRDLLLMIVNDDLDRLTEHPHVFDLTTPLEDQLVAFFAPRYVFWGREPQLSRAALREIGTSYAPGEPGVELARGVGRRSRVVERLADALTGWMTATGTHGLDDAETLAWTFYDIYITEVRLWLNSADPSLEDGLTRLRRLLRIVTIGAFAPKAARTSFA